MESRSVTAGARAIGSRAAATRTSGGRSARRRLLALVGGSLLASLAGVSPLPAQDPAPDTAPERKMLEPRGRPPADSARPPAEPRPPHAAGFYSYPWSWYGFPTQPYKRVPPDYEPRLGHIYQTPYTSWQMGIQLPEDSEPLETYSLGSFRGVVRSPQWPAWLEEAAAAAVADDDAERLGITLMRQGDFRAAGRLQAEGFRRGDDPRYALCLVESLFALEKYRHADHVLRHALAQEGAFEALSDDIAAHFASRDDFDRRLRALTSSADAPPLLSAYLQVHSSEPVAGLDSLLAIAGKDGPDREIAARLYRHFVGRAFAAPPGSTTPPAPAPEEDGARS